MTDRKLGKLVRRRVVVFSTITVSAILVVATTLLGCATSEKKVNFDFRDEQITTLTEQLDFQGKKITNLAAELNDLKRQLAKSTATAPVAAKTKKEKPKRGDKVSQTIPSVPSRQVDPELLSEALENLDDEAEGEVIADSSFETMHLYFQAVQLAKSKKLEEAVESLRRFLAANPHHIYADEAQYLMARYLYESKEYQLSVVAANQLSSRFPHSFRLPEGLYYRALSLKALGNKDEASQAMRELMKRFPQESITKEAMALVAPPEGSGRRAQIPRLLDQTQN